MASMVSTVSRSDSPLLTEEVPAENDITSADSRLAAVSNDRRVRVESSKNSETTVLPRRAGTLGLARRLTSTKLSVSRRTSAISSGARGRRWTSRWVRERAHRLHHVAKEHPVLGHVDHLVPPGGEVLAHVVGPDRQLPVATVDHHRQLDDPGPPVVGQRVERGPHGPPGEEHVVDQHHRRAGEVDLMSVVASGSTGRSPMSSR